MVYGIIQDPESREPNTNIRWNEAKGKRGVHASYGMVTCVKIIEREEREGRSSDSHLHLIFQDTEQLRALEAQTKQSFCG